MCCFNPRTRAGCDRFMAAVTVSQYCFNPRTRAGCDDVYLYNRSLIYVSIHAPARGATAARVWRSLGNLFQSTHPRGVRLQLIHKDNNFHLFQSTHPRGVRPMELIQTLLGHQFQSTHPRGVRPSASQLCLSPACFNPRTRAGCDTICLNMN